MKKLICLTLAVLMLLSLWACGGGEGEAKGSAYETLHVGYAREKLLPMLSSKDLPMGGYGNTDKRIAQNILDYLYITCIAFAEGDQTFLLYTQDMTGTNSTQVGKIREQLTAQTGIPAENIMVASTHTHSAPTQYCAGFPAVDEFNANYVEAGVKAGLDALADLAPATMYGGTVQAEGLNFIRHYLMNDGTYYGSNFGSTGSGFKDHAAPNDPTMGLLKIDREGEVEDILLMNWAAHPCFTGGINKYDVSADYIATVRDIIEQDTGMKFAFFLAASGNHNTDSYMPSDRHSMERSEYSQKLAQYALDALPNLEKIEGNGIQTTYEDITYAKNKEDIEKLTEAKEVYELFSTTGDRDAGNALAVSYGLSSVYHASAVINRNKTDETGTFRIHATRIGGFAFINAPYEMFAASGKHIRDNSPHQTTFIISMSNDGLGYYPTREAFEYGCYESYTTSWARGIAEDTADKFVGLLNALK